MRALRAVAYLTNALPVRTLVAGEQLGRRATIRDVERRTLEPGGFPMLKVLSEDVRECYRRAEECARQAKAQLNPELRRDFLDLIMSFTAAMGNIPSFRLVSVVRSAGGVLSAVLRNPFPLPSAPWHGAQLDRYAVFPASVS
jgi:hypothetical protein